MNRRELLTRGFVGLAAAATMKAQRVERADQWPEVGVEPVPLLNDFERASWCECDLWASSACMALDTLGWQSGLAPLPLLVVHPSAYAHALSVSAELGGLLQVWASKALVNDDRDTWFVAWRGRRVGSIGA